MEQLSAEAVRQAAVEEVEEVGLGVVLGAGEGKSLLAVRWPVLASDGEGGVYGEMLWAGGRWRACPAEVVLKEVRYDDGAGVLMDGHGDGGDDGAAGGIRRVA